MSLHVGRRNAQSGISEPENMPRGNNSILKVICGMMEFDVLYFITQVHSVSRQGTRSAPHSNAVLCLVPSSF